MVDRQSSAIRAGETFFHSARPNRLWVVATPPDEAGSIIAFPIFPLTQKSDDTCILSAGCHPCLRDCDYAVEYEGGKTLTAENQRFLGERNFLSWQAAFTAELTVRIQQGAADSDFTPTGYQAAIAKLLQAK
jgi:hypothetical protein